MKRILTVLVSIIMIFTLCACDSEEVKQAKEAYEKEDYAKAVKILSKEKELDQDAQDVLTVSEANVLYEKGKYLAAVKKLTSSSKGG